MFFLNTGLYLQNTFASGVQTCPGGAVRWVYILVNGR